MNFEKIKRSHLKRNIIIGLLVVSIISAIIINYTKAKYRVTQSISLVSGTINYSLADFNAVAIYIESDDGYSQIDKIPESGYTLNKEQSYCKVNNVKDDSISLSYDFNTKTLSVSPIITKNTKCYLYFDEYIIPKDFILANYSTVLTRDDFTTTITNTTTGTIYKSKDSSQYDDYGEVYYFAGNPTDNWVKFAGFYCRIIRINGDVTIRMIYQGTSANETGEGTQIGESSFNSYYNNNMYVGYMYTSNQIYGIETNSTIKDILDNWYASNLSNYSSKIDGNAGFCGDRQPSTSSSTSNGSGGTGTTTTYYGGYIRLANKTKPTFECTNSSDLYTTSGSTNGNKALTYPIGLITMDEAWYAGNNTNSSNNYLHTGISYWTMTPNRFEGERAGVFFLQTWSNNSGIIYSGSLGIMFVASSYSVRPVINLKADVTISSGTGTSANPYIIS